MCSPSHQSPVTSLVSYLILHTTVIPIQPWNHLSLKLKTLKESFPVFKWIYSVLTQAATANVPWLPSLLENLSLNCILKMRKQIKAAQQEEGRACLEVWHCEASCPHSRKASSWAQLDKGCLGEVGEQKHWGERGSKRQIVKRAVS